MYIKENNNAKLTASAHAVMFTTCLTKAEERARTP